MLKACFRAITLVAAVAAPVVLSNRVSAQQLQTLIDFTSTWKYDSSTTLGTAWTGTGFNDSAWASGQGLLGSETTPAVYPVAFNTALVAPANGGPITYYFRINFNFSGATNGATLIASNYVDDGCVIYLNGVEAGRLRVPTGQTPTTLASGGPATEGVIETLTLPVGLLRQGANVLAVEVHQGAADSSDVVWGTKLVASVPSALAITSQPLSQTIPLGSPVTFAVGVSGGPANYQWQKNSNNINGATSSSYTIGSVTANDAASYRVIVTNAVNSVTSSNAVLTVTSDVTPPKVLSAIVRETTSGVGTNLTTYFTNIDLTVDEFLNSASASPTNNYRVYNYDTGVQVPVISAAYNATTIRLALSTNNGAWRYRSNYFVRVAGLTDTRGNVMPATDIGVSWRVTTNLMQMSQNWDFFNLSVFFDPNFQVYSNYYKTNFTVNYDQGWGNGVGILWNDQDQTPPTCSSNNMLGADCGFQEAPQYFRRTFQAPANIPGSGTLKLDYVIDDGAVFYLNGREIHRFNMPAGGLAPTVRATANQNPATCRTDISANITNLMNPGMNWMAVTVYQSTGDGEGDTVMGLSMDYEVLQTGSVPSPLSISRSGSTVRVSWSGTGFALQSSTNPANAASWANVAGATSPYTAMANTFYRLRKN